MLILCGPTHKVYSKKVLVEHTTEVQANWITFLLCFSQATREMHTPGRGVGMEGLSKKEKGLMDMDNSVVIAGGDIRGLNSNGKIQYKLFKKKYVYINSIRLN